MGYLAFCLTCKVNPISLNRGEARTEYNQFCSEKCREKAYKIGSMERCLNCKIRPKLRLDNGKLVDFCGIECRNSASKPSLSTLPRPSNGSRSSKFLIPNKSKSRDSLYIDYKNSGNVNNGNNNNGIKMMTP